MGCINWGWKIRGLKTNEKLLLIALADDADKETGTCRIHCTARQLSLDCSISVRQTQRLLNRLAELNLIHWTERNPGQGDGLRLYHVHTQIDPADWLPATSELNLMRRPGMKYLLSTVEFQKAVRKEFCATAVKTDRPDEISEYDTWVSPLQVILLQGSRLLCRVPKIGHYETIYKRGYDKILLRVAQSLNPQVKKLRLIYPPEKKSAPATKH